MIQFLAKLTNNEKLEAPAESSPSMTILFTTGRKTNLQAHDLKMLLHDPKVLGLVAIGAFLMFFMNPHADVRDLSWLPRLLFIVATASVTVLAIVGTVRVLLPVWAHLGQFPMPSLLPLVVAALITEIFSRLIFQLVLGHSSWQFQTLPKVMFMNVVYLVVLTLFFRFLYFQRHICKKETTQPDVCRFSGTQLRWLAKSYHFVRCITSRPKSIMCAYALKTVKCCYAKSSHRL